MSPTKSLRRKPLTHTNTDKFCLSSSSSRLSRLWHQLSLLNGTYMLDPFEKIAINTIGLVFIVLAIIYVGVFGRGLVDGYLQSLPPPIDEEL